MVSIIESRFNVYTILAELKKTEDIGQPATKACTIFDYMGDEVFYPVGIEEVKTFRFGEDLTSFFRTDEPRMFLIGRNRGGCKTITLERFMEDGGIKCFSAAITKDFLMKL